MIRYTDIAPQPEPSALTPSKEAKRAAARKAASSVKSPKPKPVKRPKGKTARA